VRNFDRSTVKHALQNIQNDCLQWLSHSFRVHQIRFRPGLCPDPAGELTVRSPDTLTGLRGPTSNGEGREGEEDGREGKRRREEGKWWEGKGRVRSPSPLRKFLDPPL